MIHPRFEIIFPQEDASAELFGWICNKIKKPDKIEEVRDLLIQCAEQISLKLNEGGPDAWFATFDEETNQFYLDSVFANDEALAFHQNNVGPILKNMPPLLATPLDTTINTVFTTAQ